MMHPREIEKIGKIILIVAGILFILSLVFNSGILFCISVGIVVIPAMVEAIIDDVKRNNRKY